MKKLQSGSTKRWKKQIGSKEFIGKTIYTIKPHQQKKYKSNWGEIREFTWGKAKLKQKMELYSFFIKTAHIGLHTLTKFMTLIIIDV